MRNFSFVLSLLVTLATAQAHGWPPQRCSPHAVGTSRARVPETLPAVTQEIALRSPTTTGLVAFSDGTLAVGLASPSAIAFVGSRGESLGVVRVPSTIDRPLLVGPDERLIAASPTELCVIARDVTLRHCSPVFFGLTGTMLSLGSDGLAVLSNGFRTDPTVTLFDSGAWPMSTVRLSRDREDTPGSVTVTHGGYIAVAQGRSLRLIDRDTAVRSVVTLSVPAALAPLGDDLAYATTDTLVRVALDGTTLATAAITSPPFGLIPIESDRVAVLSRHGQDISVTVYSARLERIIDLTVHGRETVDVRVVDGAYIVCSDSGVIVRVGLDGREQWRLELPGVRLRPPALPDQNGGLLVATSRATLLRLGVAGHSTDAH